MILSVVGVVLSVPTGYLSVQKRLFQPCNRPLGVARINVCGGDCVVADAAVFL